MRDAPTAIMMTLCRWDEVMKLRYEANTHVQVLGTSGQANSVNKMSYH